MPSILIKLGYLSTRSYVLESLSLLHINHGALFSADIRKKDVMAEKKSTQKKILCKPCASGCCFFTGSEYIRSCVKNTNTFFFLLKSVIIFDFT